jgi:predicted ATPase
MIILGYETTDTLDECADSITYRARSLDKTNSVLLKILKGAPPSPNRLARFRRGIDAARLFQSDRILKVLRLEPLNNTLVAMFEDFGGNSLDYWIRQGGLSLSERLTIAIAICDALTDIHDAGVIHKDITPANIFWNRTTHAVKIAGFDFSSPIECTSAVPYASRSLDGTLAYLSPEQTGRMNRPLDYRSDFYTLGVTLYELFTGEKPFASANPLEMIHCHIAKRPVPPAKRPPHIPEELSDCIVKLMEKNAEDRYQSSVGIKADLVECLRQFESLGTIHSFARATQDVSTRFRLSAKLYGREGDVAILCKAFESVLTGEMAFTLVNGFSGVGKSSLVQELYRPLAVARGRYITGKYDQYQRSVPFSAVGQALSSFCDQLLCESAEVVEAWRQRILGIIGQNGAALIEVIPRLETLIGPQPALPEREARVAQNLLGKLFQDFVQMICRPEEPLVLFLDDLQWADIASLSLLKTILANRRLSGLHLVGAYRDNEVAAGDPLMLLLDELASAGLTFATIHLDNMSYETVAALVSDTLSLPVSDVSDLARIVFSKTLGNAFFTIEFLKSLYAEGLLRFDLERRKWTWDANGIHARQITDNVVTLMAGRIAQLPQSAQALLKVAACIGSTFQLRTLAVIAQNAGNQLQVLELLAPALRLGVVVARDDTHAKSSKSDIDITQTTFRFQHDRVQQAAYSLIPETERPAMHLDIARRLLGDARQREDLDGHLFEIVSHFNKGLPLIEDGNERLQVVRLSYQAGQKARKASAYHAALDFFRLARDLLPPDSFESEYDLAFEVHLGLAKSSYVAGRSAESEALYPLLFDKASTMLDKSRVHLVQMDDYHLQGAYQKAIDVQKTNLALLGEQVPSTDHEFTQAIDKELRLTPQYRGAREAADLLAAPEIDSPEMIATLRTLMSLWISAHLVSKEPMVQWSSVRLANLTLQHGKSEIAAFAFVLYAYISISRLQEFAKGYEYGDLALKLADQYDNLEMRGKVYWVHSSNGVTQLCRNSLRATEVAARAA